MVNYKEKEVKKLMLKEGFVPEFEHNGLILDWMYKSYLLHDVSFDKEGVHCAYIFRKRKIEGEYKKYGSIRVIEKLMNVSEKLGFRARFWGCDSAYRYYEKVAKLKGYKFSGEYPPSIERERKAKYKS